MLNDSEVSQIKTSITAFLDALPKSDSPYILLYTKNEEKVDQPMEEEKEKSSEPAKAIMLELPLSLK